MLFILKAYKMKTNYSYRYLNILLSIILFLSISMHSFGQVPPPPPPPNGGPGTGHGLGGNQGAPGAPIGGGLELLLILGAFYAGKKVIKTKAGKTKEE